MVFHLLINILLESSAVVCVFVFYLDIIRAPSDELQTEHEMSQSIMSRTINMLTSRRVVHETCLKPSRNNRGLHESGRPGVAVGGADSLLGQYLQNLTFFKALIILAFPIAFRNRLFVLASFRTNLEHDFSSLYKRVTFSKLCRFCFF